MTKDLFIIDTRCHLNKSIEKAFKAKGYEVEVRKKYFEVANIKSWRHLCVPGKQRFITKPWPLREDIGSHKVKHNQP